jgi:hypothetical protein
MNLQYVSDAQGRHTAVLIPIDDWNELTAQRQALEKVGEDLKKPEKIFKKPSDFRGTLTSDEADKYLVYLKQARSEWDRDI